MAMRQSSTAEAVWKRHAAALRLAGADPGPKPLEFTANENRWEFQRRYFLLYPGHARTRKSFGLMTRKLSVTELQNSGQRLGTFLRRKSSATSANSRYVA